MTDFTTTFIDSVRDTPAKPVELFPEVAVIMAAFSAMPLAGRA